MKFSFKMPSMVKARNEFDLSHNHVLTQNFGIPSVLSVIEVNRGDDVRIDLNGFTRLMPLPCPTYGSVKMIHRAYAVNLEYCIKHFNEFIGYQKVAGSTNYSQTSSNVLRHLYIPRFNVRNLIYSIFYENEFSNVEDLVDGKTYDYVELGESPKGFTLTARGRRVVSWLSQLGYKLPSVYNDLQFSEVYDCLVLFAYWKYYLDWVVPARFVLSNPRFVYIKSVLDNLDCQSHDYNLVYSPSAATDLDLKQFIMVPTSFLDDDYYTSAFSTPYGTENAAFSPVGSPISNISGLNVEGQNGLNITGNSIIDSQDYEDVAQLIYNSDGTFTQFALLSLGRLQKLVDAKKSTSSKVKDFLYTMFGSSPSKDELRMSEYLGDFESNIMIGDVMATANTQVDGINTYVGEYSGKGLAGSNANWSFKSDFCGFIFVTAELQVKSSYPNGISILRQRFDPTHFYQPNFDNIGVRAISRKELIFNSFDDDHDIDPSDIPSPTSVFGFSPRYSEYKFKNDEVTGDFMIPSVNSGLDSWYLSRKFGITDEPVVGLEFNSATSDSVGSQYDRIFQNTNNDDHFYSTYRIGIKKYANMESLFDYFETIEDEHGKSTPVSIN